jgi:hypothetical protein
MHDLDPCQCLTLTEVSKHLPGRPHISTIHRWRTKGLKGVRLRTFRVGGRRVTTVSDLEEFIAKVTAAADGDKHLPKFRSSKRRSREIARAESELARLGIWGEG